MMAGLLLGPKKGCLAVLIYILLGLMGLPIFAQGGGIGYLVQPSFGYLAGFAAGAYVTGFLAEAEKYPGIRRLLAANFAGLGIVYSLGMAWYWLISRFYLGTPIGLWPLFLYCFLLAVPGDILLCIAGACLGKRLIPLVKDGVI